MLAAWALRHVSSDTAAPPVMTTVRKAKLEGESTAGTAQSQRVARQQVETPSAAGMPRRERELVTGALVRGFSTRLKNAKATAVRGRFDFSETGG